MWKGNGNREEGPGRYFKLHRSRDIACLRTQVPKNLPFCVEQSEETGARESPGMEAHPIRSISAWETRAAKSLSSPTCSHFTEPLISVLNWLSDTLKIRREGTGCHRHMIFIGGRNNF